MAARRGPHVIKLHDSAPALLGRAPMPPPPGARDEPPPPSAVLVHHPRGGLAPHPAVAALEDRLAVRDRDIQELLVDNQRFAATHVALQQQLIAAQHELRAVSIAATRARAEREDEVRALAEQAARIEAEARAAVAARAEVDQVHADVQVLAGARTELVDRLQDLRGQLARFQAEAGKTESVRAQVETMRREIQKGRDQLLRMCWVELLISPDVCRLLLGNAASPPANVWVNTVPAAVEFEKKAHADNLEQSKAMEKNMIAVASEIEKLRGDLANAEKRATAVTATAPVANPGFPTTYGNSEATYPAPAAYGNSETTYAPTYGNTEAAYASTYGSSEAAYAAAYGNSDAYSTNQAHTRTDPHYMAPPVHYAQYDSQHTNVQR
uniref:Protein FLC EXPRESSOR n=1 Tax=Oryza meridionalis TaxID=40149 RepID=A0A0E0D8S3_9ORYZ